MAREFRLLPRRPALAGLVIVLPLIMLLVLGGIFRAGIPTGMAVAVIDLDRSDLSRAVTRMLDAAPELTVTHRASDLSEARSLIVSGAVRGAVLMPPNLERGPQYPVEEAQKVLALASQAGMAGRIQHVMIPGMIDEDDDRPIEMKPRMDVLEYWSILQPELPGMRGLCTQVTSFLDQEALGKRLCSQWT